ncbi:MAG: Dethiobiotin synthetase [Leptolyngbyaceae cyanobacterium RU_5_1]|nr:Dethiobiotin synthetase [Leptolyngbyaceae cyanobacterium RU_5_1]
MDYQTACNLLITQGIDAEQHPDALLTRLQQGIPPIPGQVTAVLLALKVLYEGLRESTQLERELACSLHRLSSESRSHFETGRKAGVIWPPLLDEDLTRIAAAVKSIFAGEWDGG